MRHDLGDTPSAAIRANRSGHNERGWSLADEKVFLDHLGTRFWSRNTQLDRVEMLRAYLASIRLRKESWVPLARKYAEKLLREEIR